MKKFSPRVAIVALIVSFFTALVATPAYAVAPDISLSSLSYFARVGQSVNAEMHPTFTVTGFSGTPTFSIQPALPAGLTMNTSTGEVTGTPTVGIDATTFTVTATYNNETDTAMFDLSVGESINISSTLNTVAPSVPNSAPIVLTFGHTSIINNSNGVITVVLQNATPTSPGSCAGVTLSPAATSCSLTLSGSTYAYQFTGVNFSNPSSTFTMTIASGTLTAGTNGMFGLNVNLANGSNVPSLNFGAPGISIGGGQNQQNQSTPFTVSNVSFDRGSSPSFSTLAVGANVPAFTMTFSGYSGGASVNQVNYLLGDPNNNVFWNIPGAVTNNSNNYVAWTPSSSTCGISAIRLGGVAQTANSGITCLKSTYSANVTQYWISLRFATPTTAEISIDTAAGVFQVSQAGNLSYFATLFNNSVNPRLLSNITQSFDASNASPNTPAVEAPVDFSFPVAVGQKILGEDVTIAASNLALSTDYSVVLRSTPQILAQGRTVTSSFNTTVTIPDNLEPGWHSITFNATRSDGAEVKEVVYFKISADGTLLATSETQPAELALTGIVSTGGISLAIIVLLMGLAAFFVAREINPEFVRVMSLVRGPDGQLDFVKRRIRSDEL